ncbi:hypothetical protein BGZ63DRAFT_431481 [Mariannaea sp. PMI_226]|nr:hypothetical protein BGZ63DRAFT_431481 [Mariannaea sp. PMI_226]
MALSELGEAHSSCNWLMCLASTQHKQPGEMGEFGSSDTSDNTFDELSQKYSTCRGRRLTPGLWIKRDPWEVTSKHDNKPRQLPPHSLLKRSAARTGDARSPGCNAAFTVFGRPSSVVAGYSKRPYSPLLDSSYVLGAYGSLHPALSVVHSTCLVAVRLMQVALVYGSAPYYSHTEEVAHTGQSSFPNHTVIDQVSNNNHQTSQSSTLDYCRPFKSRPSYPYADTELSYSTDQPFNT